MFPFTLFETKRLAYVSVTASLQVLLCGVLLAPLLPPLQAEAAWLPRDGGQKPSAALQSPAEPSSIDEVVLSATPQAEGNAQSASLAPQLNYSYQQTKSVKDVLDAKTLTDLTPPQAQLEQALTQSDLEFLWQAVLQANPVVRFSVEKVALPIEAQPQHSSQFLRKTLNLAIAGGSMASTLFLGGGAYQSMGIMAGSQAVQNMIKGKTYVASSLTPTEHIELATLVEHLKQELRTHYYGYRDKLHQWQEAQQQADKASSQYRALVKKQSTLEAFWMLDEYYHFVEAEQQAEQQALMHRLQLERLAGGIAVQQLALMVRPVALATAYERSQQQAELATTATTPNVLAKEPLLNTSPATTVEAPLLATQQDTVLKRSKRASMVSSKLRTKPTSTTALKHVIATPVATSETPLVLLKPLEDTSF